MGSIIGVVREVYRCVPDTRISESVPLLHCTTNGIIGDRHYGSTRSTGKRDIVKGFRVGTIIKNNRQCSILSLEELARIADNLGVPSVSGADLGANIVVEGIHNLTKMPSRTVYCIGETLLSSAGENFPCRPGGMALAARYGREELAAYFSKRAMGLRGQVGFFRLEGTITPGDEVRVVLP